MRHPHLHLLSTRISTRMIYSANVFGRIKIAKGIYWPPARSDLSLILWIFQKPIRSCTRFAISSSFASTTGARNSRGGSSAETFPLLVGLRVRASRALCLLPVHLTQRKSPCYVLRF